MKNTTTTRTDILAALADLDRGDGCLGVIVDCAMRDGITDPSEIREIAEEAEADAQADANDWAGDFGRLCEYSTGTDLRAASREERDASREQAQRDGGAGVIILNGELRCYVQE